MLLLLEVNPSLQVGLAENGSRPRAWLHSAPSRTQCSSAALGSSAPPQLSSRPKIQVGHPNDHAEVDTTVGEAHLWSLSTFWGGISKHSELLLVHLLAMHSLFSGLPVGLELIVTASAQGLAQHA